MLPKEFEQAESRTCLVRDVNPGGLLLPNSQYTANSSSSSVPVTILGPGNMSHTSHSKSGDLRPLSDRLEPERNPRVSSGTPSAGSLARLLEQAITSGDDKLLEEVLRVPKEKLISSTVKGLPVHVVLPFLTKVISLNCVVCLRPPNSAASQK